MQLPRSLLLFLLFSPALLQAQSYMLDNWQVEDGLPNNSIRVITQTSDGYLWIGANGGLARFDGIHFTTYDIARTQKLRSNRIISLFEDSKKRLWIGTYGGGLSYYENGKFNLFDLKLPESDFSSISVISETPGTGLLIGTSDRGMFILKPDGRLLHFDKNSGLLSNSIHSFLTVKDELWIVTATGIHIYKNDSLSDAPINKSLPHLEDIFAIQYLEKKDALVGIMKSKMEAFPQLFVYRNGKYTVIPYSYWEGNNMEGNSLFNDSKGNLYLKTISGLTCLYIDTTFSLSNFLQNEQENMLKEVSAFYEDREGNIWIGTNADGLYRARANPFSTLDYDKNKAGNSVLCITKDNEKNLWWATPKRGIRKLEKGKILNKTPGINNIWVVHAMEDTVYFSGYSMNWQYYVKDKLHTERFPEKKLQWVKAITKYQHNIYLGTYSELLIWNNGKWLKPTHPELFYDVHINRFFTDRDSNLWVCADKGIFCIEKNGEAFSLNKKLNKEISHVRSAYETADGTLLFGTYGNGLMAYRGNELMEINTADGLFDNTISGMLQYDKHLWLIGNMGLSRIPLSELEGFLQKRINYLNCILYDKSDGLVVSEFNGGAQTSIVHLENNVYAFPTINGIALVDFNKIEKNNKPPNVVIEEVRADKQLLDISKKIILPFDQNRIEITYTALSLTSAKNNKFKYRLEGYDNTWNDAGTERKAVYTQLPPGNYTFTVIACNNDGVWNNAGKSISIEIIPPFYLTTWFNVVLFFAIVLLIAAVIYIIIAGVRKKEKQKTDMVLVEQNAKIKAIMQTEEYERKRIAEDLHDGIGPLLSTIKLNLARANRSEHPGELIESSQQHIDHISNELRNITYNLVPTSLETFGLGVAVKEFLEKMKSGGHIKIKYYEHGEITRLNKNSQLFVFRTIQEILNNSIKHSQGSEITVQLVAHEDMLMVMVEDNGTGFNFEEAFAKTGSRGLKNIRDRIAAVNGSLAVSSDMNSGTTFTIEIPFD